MVIAIRDMAHDWKYVLTRMPVGAENEYNIICFCLDGPGCDVLGETAKRFRHCVGRVT